MDDDSCVLKYIEIVPLDNNAQQFEDIKPFQVKVCIATNLVAWITDYKTWGWSMHNLQRPNESTLSPMEYCDDMVIGCCQSIHYFGQKNCKIAGSID